MTKTTVIHTLSTMFTWKLFSDYLQRTKACTETEINLKVGFLFCFYSFFCWHAKCILFFTMHLSFVEKSHKSMLCELFICSMNEPESSPDRLPWDFSTFRFCADPTTNIYYHTKSWFWIRPSEHDTNKQSTQYNYRAICWHAKQIIVHNTLLWTKHQNHYCVSCLFLHVHPEFDSEPGLNHYSVWTVLFIPHSLRLSVSTTNQSCYCVKMHVNNNGFPLFHWFICSWSHFSWPLHV